MHLWFPDLEILCIYIIVFIYFAIDMSLEKVFLLSELNACFYTYFPFNYFTIFVSTILLVLVLENILKFKID